jgi:predicted protein tyrosine phosphatase
LKVEGILFNEDMAEKIVNFLEAMDTSKDLYVHCFAGICRSGAVASFANDYFYNKGVIDDFERELFASRNRQIVPNRLVYSLLKRKVFGGYKDS